MAPNNLLSIKQAAEFLGGISVQTLYGWVCDRLIPFVKVGRRDMFRPEDLIKFIERRSVQARTTAWPKRSRGVRKQKTLTSSTSSSPFNFQGFPLDGVPNGTYEMVIPDGPIPGCRFTMTLNVDPPWG
jgi:excisionase family DNA binding protein